MDSKQTTQQPQPRTAGRRHRAGASQADAPGTEEQVSPHGAGSSGLPMAYGSREGPVAVEAFSSGCRERGLLPEAMTQGRVVGFCGPGWASDLKANSKSGNAQSRLRGSQSSCLFPQHQAEASRG